MGDVPDRREVSGKLVIPSCDADEFETRTKSANVLTACTALVPGERPMTY